MFRSMQKHPFEKPVRFIRRGSLVERISSADEAAYYLLHRWPVSGGTAYQFARERCRGVLAGTCDQEEARRAFVAALAEAGLEALE